MNFDNYLEGKTTVGSMVDAISSSYPDTEAIVYYAHSKSIDEAERITYREYHEKINQLAKSLMAIGVNKGDHVAIWMPNYPEWVFAQMATGKIGAVLVTINTMLKIYEVEYILKQSDAKTLLLADEFVGTMYMSMLNEMVPELQESEFGYLSSAEFPLLKNVMTLSRVDRSRKYAGTITFDELMLKGNAISDEELAERQNSVTEDDAAMILYTSGTTGMPKGAMLTHKGNIMNNYNFGLGMGCNHGDVYLNPLPLFHVGCSHLGSYCTLTLGFTFVTVDRFEPEKALQIIEKERVTTVGGTPTHFITELQHPNFKKYNLSSLRTGFMAGAACPVQLVKDVMSKMHARDLTILFGQTETSGCISQSKRDDPPEIKAETVGKPMLGVEVVIKDPTTNKSLPYGEVGEVCARGFNNMKGYYKKPEETANTIDSEGWLHLGDLGTMDEEGNIRFRGRIKDMIIVGGENVYVAEVEQFLEKHPKVIAAYVIGVPDQKYGEVTMAYLETTEEVTFEEIYDFCKGRIASFKIPRYIANNDEVPRTASGKVQKFKLREIATDKLGLSS